jgi:hypothetical protein
LEARLSQVPRPPLPQASWPPPPRPSGWRPSAPPQVPDKHAAKAFRRGSSGFPGKGRTSWEFGTYPDDLARESTHFVLVGRPPRPRRRGTSGAVSAFLLRGVPAGLLAVLSWMALERGSLRPPRRCLLPPPRPGAKEPPRNPRPHNFSLGRRRLRGARLPCTRIRPSRSGAQVGVRCAVGDSAAQSITTAGTAASFFSSPARP